MTEYQQLAQAAHAEDTKVLATGRETGWSMGRGEDAIALTQDGRFIHIVDEYGEGGGGLGYQEVFLEEVEQLLNEARANSLWEVARAQARLAALPQELEDYEAFGRRLKELQTEEEVRRAAGEEPPPRPRRRR